MTMRWMGVQLKSGRSVGDGKQAIARPIAAAIWLAWAADIVCSVVGVAVSLPAGNDPFTVAIGLAGTVGAISLATVGVVLVTRLPRHPVGWLLLTGGLGFGLGNFGSSPLPADLPFVAWLAWLANLGWAPAIVAVGILLPLVFPTGRLPSPRWRIVVVIAAIALSLSEIQSAFSPFANGNAPPGVSNPLALGSDMSGILSAAGTLSTLAAIIFFPVAAASLVVRYRRAAGAERAQLRWLAAALAIIGPGFAIGFASDTATSGVMLIVQDTAWLVAMSGLAVIPVAVGIAVLRYRLYDIDRLISRSIGWSILTLVLGATFTGLVLVLQAAFAPVLQSSEPAVATSTLVVAMLFQPARRLIQESVDRRFNRSRHDSERTAAEFMRRLRGEVDLEAVRLDLIGTVKTALEPQVGNVWIR